MFLVDESKIKKYEKLLPSDLTAIPGTMKMHQNLVADPNSTSASCQNVPAFSLCTASISSELVKLTKVECVDEDLIGKYVVVSYDGLPFPGIVLDVDEEDLEVKVMHKIGKNRYFWPRIEDQCWYTKDKVIILLQKEPEHVTARHCELPKKLWELIVKELDI